MCWKDKQLRDSNLIKLRLRLWQVLQGSSTRTVQFRVTHLKWMLSTESGLLWRRMLWRTPSRVEMQQMQDVLLDRFLLSTQSTCSRMLFERVIYMFYDIDSIFSTPYQKEEVKIKSCVTTLIRHMWYIFESRSTRSNRPKIHWTHVFFIWNNAYDKWSKLRYSNLLTLKRSLKISRSNL